MSNELVVGMIAAVGLAATAIVIARFMILDDPTNAIRQRVGRVMHDSDPDLRARVALQDLQRPADRVHRAEDERVGR